MSVQTSNRRRRSTKTYIDLRHSDWHRIHNSVVHISVVEDETGVELVVAECVQTNTVFILRERVDGEIKSP